MASDEKAILRAAHKMIDRYGEHALVEVDLRITELRLHGQHQAEELWRDIRNAVRILSGTPERDAKH